MWVPRGKDLVCFSSFSDRADDGEATTLELGVCGGMWVWTRLMSVCKTCGSGICQQSKKGIRCLRKMWSAHFARPCSSSQLLSNSFLSMWLARRRAGEQAQCLSNRCPGRAGRALGSGRRGERHTQERYEHLHPSWAGSATASSSTAF